MTPKIAILVGRNRWNIKDEDLAIIGAIIRVVLIIWLFIMLQSCSAQWHLNRAIKKDPTIIADTIVRLDTTVVTQSISVVDTLIVRDTIVRQINREGVKIKIQRIHDTIRVDVVCPPDTIQIIKDVPVEQIIYKEKALPLYKRTINILYLILSIVVIAWIYRLMK